MPYDMTELLKLDSFFKIFKYFKKINIFRPYFNLDMVWYIQLSIKHLNYIIYKLYYLI
jgi:hypothetical protein